MSYGCSYPLKGKNIHGPSVDLACAGTTGGGHYPARAQNFVTNFKKTIWHF